MTSQEVEDIVRNVLRGPEKADLSLLRQSLGAAPPLPAMVVASLFDHMSLSPKLWLQSVASCYMFSRSTLVQQFLHGESLAAALRVGGGCIAPSVADLAGRALGGAEAAGALAHVASTFWPALARAEGVSSWQDLPPTSARAGAVQLLRRRPELRPPDASAALWLRWLAQAAAPEAERAALLEEARRLWDEQAVATTIRAEDTFAALLHDMPPYAQSTEWLAAVAARPPLPSASRWLCSLVAGLAGTMAAAASELVRVPSGSGALLFAWVTLYGAALHACLPASCVGVAPTGAAAFDSGCLVPVLGLLGSIGELLASQNCWQEIVAMAIFVVLRWPQSGEALPGTWVEFARRLLLELPDRYPSSPLAIVLPSLLNAVPWCKQDIVLKDGTLPADERVALVGLLKERSASARQAVGVGLRNIGNTCYLNSFLQALWLTESFATDLFAQFPPLIGGATDTEEPQQAAPPGKGAELQKALAQVLTRLSVSRKAFAPSTLASQTPFGLGGRQQDVTELARWIFEQVGDAERDGSLTARSFGGRGASVIWCRACGHQQEKAEAFSDLCLPLELGAAPAEGGEAMAESGAEGQQSEPLGVASLLRSYLSEEGLQGYRCDACGAEGTSCRRWQVTRPPEQLVVTLNRFAFTAAGGQEKVDVHVTASRLLELPVSSPEAQEATASYALYAIINHIGSSPRCGHYICLGRGSEGAAGESAWSCFDDMSVSAMGREEPSQEVLDTRANGRATAYMLLYRRCDGAPRRPARRRLPERLFAEAVLQDLDLPQQAASAGGAPPTPSRGSPPGGSLDGCTPGAGPAAGGGGWVC